MKGCRAPFIGRERTSLSLLNHLKCFFLFKHMSMNHTCGDFVECNGLRGSSPQSHAHSLKQLLFGKKVLVLWQDLGEA